MPEVAAPKAADYDPKFAYLFMAPVSEDAPEDDDEVF